MKRYNLVAPSMNLARDLAEDLRLGVHECNFISGGGEARGLTGPVFVTTGGLSKVSSALYSRFNDTMIVLEDLANRGSIRIVYINLTSWQDLTSLSDKGRSSPSSGV